MASLTATFIVHIGGFALALVLLKLFNQPIDFLGLPVTFVACTTLYLAALGRKPTAAESAKLVPYVEKGGPAGDPNQALADVFWALLNSSEFVFNP